MFWKIIRLAPLSCAVYPLFALEAWIATLLAWVLSPLIAGVSMATGRNEVRLFWLFYTHDASLDGGIEQGKDGYDPNAQGLKLWWQRVCWICRNPAYGFCAYIVGCSADGSVIILERGSAYPPDHHLVVIELQSGFRIFGYRDGRRWFGWKHTPIAGRHQLKAKPF